MIAELIILNVCHFAGDYTHLSRPWMLAAKKNGTPLLPILAHASVHGVLMAIAIGAMCGAWFGLLTFAIQVPTHFAIDVAKGRLNTMGGDVANPASYWHWWAFGGDQFLHQLVIILIAYIVS